jgi:hypothetical protein
MRKDEGNNIQCCGSRSGAFFKPGSGMGKKIKIRIRIRMKIPDHISESLKRIVR